jgi:MFS-type transporter involved in bile tolerance (Atg22 family)
MEGRISFISAFGVSSLLSLSLIIVTLTPHLLPLVKVLTSLEVQFNGSKVTFNSLLTILLFCERRLFPVPTFSIQSTDISVPDSTRAS